MTARKTSRGFTLIELMIVISIIALLAAIIVINFLHARASSQTATCEGNLKQLATALEEYAVDYGGTYPTSIAQLQAANGGVYLKNIPTDPAGGAYAIVVPAGAPCSALGSPSYQITDGNNHDSSTTQNLPNHTATTTGIDYCSGYGLSAHN